MVKRPVQKVSVAGTCSSMMPASRHVIAGLFALCLLRGVAHSEQIPAEVFLDPVAAQKVRSLYQQRDNTLRPKIELITRFYAEILPDRVAKKANVDSAQRALSLKKRSNRGNVFQADPTVQAAHDALAYATRELMNDQDYEQAFPLVAEAQEEIRKTYYALRQFLPKSPNDPLIEAVTAAFESGCDSPYAPVEAHLLSAISASYGGQHDFALKHLRTIESERLFDKWPEWPGLTGDFCVACALLDSMEICKTQHERLEGWREEADDPHVLWSIAMCRALSKKGLPGVYFRKAAIRDSKQSVPDSVMEEILFDCLAYTAFGRQTLPRRLKELAGSQSLQGSGLSQAFFARAALAESEAQREQLLQEGLRRCPPAARKVIAASFRSTGEPKEGGGVKEPEVPVGLD